MDRNRLKREYILDNKKDISDKYGVPMDFMDMLDEESKVEIYVLGEVVNTVYKDLAICYDIEENILIKIGELDYILGYYNTALAAYRGLNSDVGDKMADNLGVVTIPKNNRLANRLLDTSGYLKVYLRNIKKLDDIAERGIQ